MNYVGRKIKGFEFYHETDSLHWNPDMAQKIGQEGEIVGRQLNGLQVKFDDGQLWYYPISLIEHHLIPLEPTRIEQEHAEMLEVLQRVLRENNCTPDLDRVIEQLIEKVNKP